MTKLVSIIIPVYNSAPFLKECLDSVAAQTYRPLEVIIINDGSTDNSEEIIRTYLDTYSFFSYVSQENHGLGYTRNKGINLSRGESIFFLDSDDIIPEHAIEMLTRAKEKCGADFAAGKVLRFTNERNYIPVRHHEFGLYEKDTCIALSSEPRLVQDSIACNKLWSASFLKEHSLYFEEGKYYEDMHLTLKAAVLARKIAIVKEPVYLWRVREEANSPSITQQRMKLRNTLDRITALNLNKEWLTKTGINQKIATEHDLKALLDVLRLHVEKYALVDKTDREDWQKAICSFLSDFSAAAIALLPHKEKTLYDLAVSGQLSDLLLFSQLYTGTETMPIVHQSENRFYLKGAEATYDITADIKPHASVVDFEEQEGKWSLRGKLKVPKASQSPSGRFYATGKKFKKEVTLSSVTFEPIPNKSFYPFEKQTFTLLLHSDEFKDKQLENGYDFYFCLDGGKPVRIKASKSLELRLVSYQTSKRKVSLYRTEYGNLSLQVHKGFFYNLLRKIYRLIK
ncbi:glycosyltransferase family 2 protein [Bacillus sp. B-jedd]|uniref:glycosyltransferase family 2 protein n=1 Tax=Bacillus sp. B-jedd TaxID=1476857 RepID=UPI000515610F|nr:glycosyltransferase family 2 protein [Bacillus sp. B-jedd]CEG29091.1 glycosyltransferase [Bacillus sp. B-jedd]